MLQVTQLTFIWKRYKSSNDEHWVKDVVLEGEQGQTHVGENEILCQEIQQFKQLQHSRKNNMCFRQELQKHSTAKTLGLCDSDPIKLKL